MLIKIGSQSDIIPSYVFSISETDFIKDVNTKRIKLRANSTTQIVSGNYTLVGTLSEEYRPVKEVVKIILFGFGVQSILRIETTGEITIYPENNINVNNSIYIDETFI